MTHFRGRKYLFNAKDNFYHPDGSASLFYDFDGVPADEKLLEVILQCGNLSLGSLELNSQINDWSTRYHLSSQRADLLRPLLNIIEGAEILEIGSGCGTITRYLAETGKEITALEGNSVRAAITAARCRDLKNVRVYNDTFLDFEPGKEFDVVTLIGVLEYARVHVDAADPVQEMLKRTKSFLKPGGVVIIAIENQLGLKYFAGAPQDHLGKPYFGIENRYAENGPVTFGKKELEKILHGTGFETQEFLFAFPDFKFPLAIITSNGTLDQTINLADILKTRTTYFQDSNYISSFSEEEVWPVIKKNNLIGDLANSFLIVASVSAIDKFDANILAYTFSDERRRPEFCKLNKFIRSKQKYLVYRQQKYPAIQNSAKKISHNLSKEEYIQGELYLNGLLKILHQQDWQIEAVYEWFKPWVDYLVSLSVKNKEGRYFIDGKYFDASPFNAFISKSGNGFQLFDLEWHVNENLRLDYVLFRTLYYSFNYIEKFQKPENTNYSKRFEIVLDILKQFFNGDLLDLGYYRRKEEELLSEIITTVPAHFFDSDIRYDKVKVHSFGNSIFNPLQEIAAQFFWKYAGSDFSESASITELVKLRNTPVIVKYNLPVNSVNLDAIRFDIGNEVGFVNIHDIKLVDGSGVVLWIWDKETEGQNDTFLIEDKIKWPGKIVQLAASDDPYFIIKANEKFKAQIKPASYLELSVSALDDNQYRDLKYLPSALKYTSGTDENNQADIVLKLDSIQQQLQFFEGSEKKVTELQNSIFLLTKEKSERDEELIAAQNKFIVQGIENSTIQVKLQEQIDILQDKLGILTKEKNESDNLMAAATEKLTLQHTENAKAQLKQQEQIEVLQKKLEISLKETGDANILLASTREKFALQLAENNKAHAVQQQEINLLHDQFAASARENTMLHEEIKLITATNELLQAAMQANKISEEKLNAQIQSRSEQLDKLIDQNNILLETAIKRESDNSELHLLCATLSQQVNDLQQNYLEVQDRLTREMEFNVEKAKKIETLNAIIEKFTDFYEKNKFISVLFNKLKGKKVTP